MALRSRVFQKRKVSLAVQALWIHEYFPSFKWIRRGSLGVWRGELQPREISPKYQIEISYRLGYRPKVRVISPVLAPDAPHMYPDRSLCLYWPKEWDWNGQRLIAETILPWTAIWLYYYELWCDTGKWHGPQSPHAGPKSTQRGGNGD